MSDECPQATSPPLIRDGLGWSRWWLVKVYMYYGNSHLIVNGDYNPREDSFCPITA